MLLRLHGYEACTAHDGIETLAIGERFRPGLVLLDIGMPGMNGYDTCRALRAQPWGREAIVVAQTGWGQSEEPVDRNRPGIDAARRPGLRTPQVVGCFTKIAAEVATQDR